MRFLGGMIVGSLAARQAARRQFEAMQECTCSAGTNKARTGPGCRGKTNSTIGTGKTNSTSCTGKTNIWSF